MSEGIVQFVDEIAGLYFRTILLPKSGMRVEQHTHAYDHATYCGHGSAQLYVDGEPTSIVQIGQAVEVKAHKRHEFIALEDGTLLTCIHHTASAEAAREN